MPKRKLTEMTESEMRDVVLMEYNMRNTLQTVEMDAARKRIKFTASGFLPEGSVWFDRLDKNQEDYLRAGNFKLPKDMNIAEKLQEFIDLDGQLSGPGGIFRGSDFKALQSVLDGTADNFVVFDNGGGRPFHVWVFAELLSRDSGRTLDGFRKFTDEMKPYVYMRKLEGKEEIFKNLPQY